MLKHFQYIVLLTFLFAAVLPAKGSNHTGDSTTMKPKILYIFDPMCGWCFGFGTVMNKLQAELKDSFDFDVISGGMVVGDREGPIGNFAEYILGAYHRVEEYSGVKFGEPYLKQLRDKSMWSSSVTPAIAIETFKHFAPEHALTFSHEVQEAYFVDGLDLRQDSVYSHLIKKYGIAEQTFLNKLHGEDMRKQTNDWFQTTRNWGIDGYPTVILVHKDKYYAVARGYTDLNTLKQTIQSVLNRD